MEARDLTKAEVVAAYEAELVGRTEGAELLRAMGYDDREADTILALADARLSRARTNDEIEEVHQQYLAYQVDDDGVAGTLNRLGLPAGRVRALSLKWAREREKAVPDFSLTVLEGMVRSRAMEPSVAQEFLQRQGWRPNQVGYLLRWWIGREVAAQAKAQRAE
jgi:hypothetical protein